jgi:hypothetical protein
MKPVERLGEARTPDGSRLELLRHDGAFLIRANGIELMSSRRHLSEDRLAEVACAPIAERSRARALIGGLGLGFTLRAALGQLGADAEVVVAELLPEVIAWNSNPEWKISTEAIAATVADVVVSGGGVENDHLLWSDVRTMGAILGEFISVQDGDEVLVKVETMRKMARESRSSSSSSSLSGGDDII